MVPYPAARDLPHALVEWVTMLIVTRRVTGAASFRRTSGRSSASCTCAVATLSRVSRPASGYPSAPPTPTSPLRPACSRAARRACSRHCAQPTYKYDVRGRQIETTDPDKGKSTTVYDKGGRATDVTDAREITLHTDYDELGRTTALKKGTATLAAWTYDTIAKGQLRPISLRPCWEEPIEIRETSSRCGPKRTLQKCESLSSGFGMR